MKRKEDELEEEEQEEGEEEEGEEEEEEEEGGEEAIRRLDKKIAYVGGLLVERARRFARLRELAENPGKALARMEQEEEEAAVALGNDTLPSVVGMIRRRGGDSSEVEVNNGSRWSSYLEQYLEQQPAALR